MAGPRRLVDWPWVVVEVECSLCRRHGRYRLARVAERYGAEMDLAALLLALARGCGLLKPEANERQYEARCGVRYRIPAGDALPAVAPAREAALGEVWPPRTRRLGPAGPLPTIADTLRQGVTHIELHCYGLLSGSYCHHTARIAIADLKVARDLPFVHIVRTRRFRCSRCGTASRANVSAIWPGPREAQARRMSGGAPLM